MYALLMMLTIALYSAATIMQKHAINRMKKFSLRLLVKNRLWLSSFAVGIFGTAAYLLALASGPFSFVQTALSATVVIPVVAGALLFKEKLSVVEWLSVVLLSAGIILYSL